MPQHKLLQACTRNYALVRSGVALLAISWALLHGPHSGRLFGLLLGYLAFGLLSFLLAPRPERQTQALLTSGLIDAIFIGTTLSLHPELPLLLAAPVLMICGHWALPTLASRQLTAQHLAALGIAWGVSGWHLGPIGQLLGALYLAASAWLVLRPGKPIATRPQSPALAEDRRDMATAAATADGGEMPPTPLPAPIQAATAEKAEQGHILYLLGKSGDSQALIDQIEGWGYRVQASADLARLVTLAYPGAKHAQVLPTSLVLDLRGRTEDAHKISHLFSSSPTLSRLRVLLLTETLSELERSSLMRNGYAAVITAPIDKTVLFNALRAEPEGTGEQRVTSLFQHYLRSQNPVPTLKILLAMPSQLQLKVNRRQLERDGHFVMSTTSGEQVLDTLASEHFDVVLIHVSLPDIDGYEVAQIYRLTQPRDLDSVLVLLAEHVSSAVQQRSLQVGASDVLALPLQQVQLRELLQRIRKGDAPDQRAIGQPVELTPDPKTTVLEQDTLVTLEQLGNGLDFMQELANRFINDSKYMRNELYQAIERRDTETFRDCAHALKGSAGSVGAARLQLFCLNLANLTSRQFLDNRDCLLRHLDDTLEEANDALLKYINQRQEQASGR